ncbi:MAG: glycosyltransferase family 8 protein [Methylobacter sp.]|nr:glycosyltransferase family 8 protein [Methylobacter sp.]
MCKLNVVFAIDKNYIEQFTVACVSLLENNKEIVGRIFLVTNVDDSNPKLFKSISFIKSRYGIVIETLGLNSEILSKFKITHHVSTATYFRLLLSDILPKSIEKVLFLDADLIVNGELNELLRLSFSPYSDAKESHDIYVYAVNHRYSKKELERLAFAQFNSDTYFNAGVMYINLKIWRDNCIASRLIENAEKYNENLLWWDQDVLNITFEDKWSELDYKYNSFQLTERSESDYKIIHYTGSSKPWHFRNNHPYKHLYWKYLRMTPYRYTLPTDLTPLNVLKWMAPEFVKKKLKRIFVRKINS